MENDDIIKAMQNVAIKLQQLEYQNLCDEFGSNHGCRKYCPVYDAEQCPNQLDNERFFKWLESNDRWK